MADLQSTKVELLAAMKSSQGELSATQMYKILEVKHLEGKVFIPPDVDLIKYIQSKRIMVENSTKA